MGERTGEIKPSTYAAIAGKLVSFRHPADEGRGVKEMEGRGGIKQRVRRRVDKIGKTRGVSGEVNVRKRLQHIIHTVSYMYACFEAVIY